MDGGTVGLLGLYAQYYTAGTYTMSFIDNTVTGHIENIGSYVNDAIGGATYVAGASLKIIIDDNMLTHGSSTADGIQIGDTIVNGAAGSVTAIITHNTISNWPKGIELFDTVDYINTHVNFNNIANNTFGLSNNMTSGSNNIDATYNWWGSASGPGSVGPGLGDKITTFVSFDPWLCAPYPTAWYSDAGKCIGRAPLGLSIYTVKKAALICDQAASIGTGSTPVFGDAEYGCIDVSDPNSGVSGNLITDYRFNQYLFSGEQLAELVVVRDTDGAQFINSNGLLFVNGASKTPCSDVTSSHYELGTNLWYGHDVSSLFSTNPPGGFTLTTDKVFECIWTVSSSDSGNSPIYVSIGDVEGDTAKTNQQFWWLNPSISIAVSFSDGGSQISFPPAEASQTVQSANNMIITNTAVGGVDLAVFLAGNNLYDTSGIGKCPTTNVLSITNMKYRCEVGTYMSEQYTPLQLLNTKADCYSLIGQHCLVDKYDGTDRIVQLVDGGYMPNTLIPDASAGTQGGLLATDVLHNGASTQCSFQLTIPFPCIGTYTANNALDILVRAI